MPFMPFLSPSSLGLVTPREPVCRATCRDVLGVGSVLGHHPVTVALASSIDMYNNDVGKRFMK